MSGRGRSIISAVSDTTDGIPDVTPAYVLWDQLFTAGLRLALSTSSDDPREAEEAWERLIRGQTRYLAERDAMWDRIARKWRPRGDGE
jgi:hypothetical protein